MLVETEMNAKVKKTLTSTNAIMKAIATAESRITVVKMGSIARLCTSSVWMLRSRGRKVCGMGWLIRESACYAGTRLTGWRQRWSDLVREYAKTIAWAMPKRV